MTGHIKGGHFSIGGPLPEKRPKKEVLASIVKAKTNAGRKFICSYCFAEFACNGDRKRHQEVCDAKSS